MTQNICNIENDVLSLKWIVGIDPPMTRGNPFSSSASFERANINGFKMKEIPLTRGMVAIIDDDDYEYISQFKWAAHRSGLSFCGIRTKQERGIKRSILLHRVIMNTPIGMECDHINHNALDNRKCNLRNCTRSENARNRVGTGRIKYLGVSKRSADRKYEARIKVNGKLIRLGGFVHTWAAAIAYDNAAKKYFGEFANPNFK